MVLVPKVHCHRIKYRVLLNPHWKRDDILSKSTRRMKRARSFHELAFSPENRQPIFIWYLLSIGIESRISFWKCNLSWPRLMAPPSSSIEPSGTSILEINYAQWITVHRFAGHRLWCEYFVLDLIWEILM